MTSKHRVVVCCGDLRPVVLHNECVQQRSPGRQSSSATRQPHEISLELVPKEEPITKLAISCRPLQPRPRYYFIYGTADRTTTLLAELYSTYTGLPAFSSNFQGASSTRGRKSSTCRPSYTCEDTGGVASHIH